LLVLILGWMAAAAPAAPGLPSPSMTTRLVVQLKEEAQAQRSVSPRTTSERMDRARERIRGLSQKAGVALALRHQLGDGSYVVEMAQAKTVQDAEALAGALAGQPDVESVGVDVWVRRQAFIPNDLHFPEQWALQPASYGVIGSARFSDAWDVGGAAFTGSPSVVVALIDTGRVRHVDLETNEIDGYDFVSAGLIRGIEASGDGSGRDPDPSDPGDYCLAWDATPDERESSWHGLKMASILAALTHNVQGIAGAAPGVRVQHIRALGRCGGWLTDVADALRWAAGAPVSGVPANPSAPQVRVANLSLGSGPGLDCNSDAYRYMRDAVRAAQAAGVVVVAAAGNERSTSVGLPAGCSGVLAVGAHTSRGELADYSNRAPRVSLTAPGGGCPALGAGSCDDTLIVALGNSGTREPAANLWRDETAGTSAATPFVSAAAALMISLDDTLTPYQVRTILTETARPHPPGSFCATNPGVCGTGMLDAEAAVVRVRDGPIPDNPRSSGGGGALAWGWLALLGLAVLRARRLQI
jgi:serine protease